MIPVRCVCWLIFISREQWVSSRIAKRQWSFMLYAMATDLGYSKAHILLGDIYYYFEGEI